MAVAFGVASGTVMATVVEHGTPLVDDPDRLAGVQALGVDEIAFLGFIGVIREQLGSVEDPLFSTVFLRSGLLLLAMLLFGAIVSTSPLAILDTPNIDADVWEFGRDTAQELFAVYAMRMAAVFTLSVSTVGMRAAAMPRWVTLLGYLVSLALPVGSGGHRWVQLAFPAWVLLVSIVIVTRSHRPMPPTPS